MLSAINYSLNSVLHALVAEDIIEPTFTTPFVKYDKTRNALTIKGSSTRKNIVQFYDRVLGDFKYNLRTKRRGELHLNFTMFGPSTLKILFSLLRFISKEQQLGTKVDVVWSVAGAEVEMLDTIRDFAELYDLRLKIR